MGTVVALDYFVSDRLSAERQRQQAIRLAEIQERIGEITLEIAEWNGAQLRRAYLIKIAEAVGAYMFDDAPEIMTLTETARRLGIHYRTAMKLARRGEIPALHVGGSWRVSRVALIEWIAANQGRSKKEGEGL